MYLYIIFSILSLLAIAEVCHIKIKGYPSFYKHAYVLVLCVVFLLSMLRWENGTDWDSYYSYFSLVGVNPESGDMEPGFTWLCHFNYNYLNYTLHLGIMAFLCIVPVAIRIKQFSPFPIFALLIWFSVSFAHMFPVRQTVAISLFVFSWKYIQDRRLIPFLCTIALAATFHATALITLPIYFLWNRHIPAKIYVIVIVGVFVLSMVSSQLFANLLYGVGGALFEEKLNTYMENADEAFGAAYSPMQALIRGCINRSVYFFIPLFLLNAKRKENAVMNAIFNMYFYSFVIFLMVTPLSVALGRLTMFTDMAQLLLLPFVFTLKMNRVNSLGIIVVMILYLAIRFRGVVFNYEDLYIPYHCVLFN